MGSVEDASKLASMLMLFIFILIFLERYQRRNRRYKSSGKDFKPISKQKLKGKKNILAFYSLFYSFFSLDFYYHLHKCLTGFIFHMKMLLMKIFLTTLYQTMSLGISSAV